MQWKEALADHGYYFYLVNVAGAASMSLPKKAQNVSFTAALAEHMANPNRYVPTSLQEATIKGSKGIPDPLLDQEQEYITQQCIEMANLIAGRQNPNTLLDTKFESNNTRATDQSTVGVTKITIDKHGQKVRETLYPF